MTSEMELINISKTDISSIELLLKNSLPFKDISSKINHLFLGCIQGTIVEVEGGEIYRRYVDYFAPSSSKSNIEKQN